VNRISVLILVGTLSLAACAPAGKSSDSSLTGTTGYTSPEGYDYVANGDERVEQALREPTPSAPAKVSPTTATKPLREQLKEFQISRFATNESTPSRFGEAKVSVKFIFNGKPSVEFKTDLIGSKPKFNVNAVSGAYTLAGELNDGEQQTRGEFTLSHNATGESARVFYWAYKAKLHVRQNRSAPVASGSDFEKQIADLRDNTFGWVNNWNVVRGVSFFLVDIVKVVNQNPQGGSPVGSLLSFQGPSLRTGEAVHDVQEVAGAPSRIQLVGNGEEGAGRIFQVTVQDPKTKQSNEFMLDVELETPTMPGESVGSQPIPARPATPPQVAEEPEVETPKAPGPAQPEPTEPAVTGKSYLRISTSLPRTTKMTRDFNRNRNLTGVKKWMEKYSGNWRGSLQKFYTYANPFRRVMEKIGQAFDVSPAYAYLTVIESVYFTGGKYRIEGAEGSSALGPFQLLIRTAREMGLLVGGSGDERRYFVPSACGAAKYVRTLVDKFDDSDATVAILGYFQGDGGAAAAIYCSFDPNAGDRQECVRRINKSYTGADYGRFLKLTKNYDYSFAEMDRMAAISQPMRDYVNKKLAIYFISNDIGKYGFTTDGAPTSFPDNGTVMPARALKDRECHNAVSELL